MKYSELKKEIKNTKKDSILSYISTWGDNNTVSNFLTEMPSFDQLCRAETEGLLIRDYDTLIVA